MRDQTAPPRPKYSQPNAQTNVHATSAARRQTGNPAAANDQIAQIARLIVQHDEPNAQINVHTTSAARNQTENPGVANNQIALIVRNGIALRARHDNHAHHWMN